MATWQEMEGLQGDQQPDWQHLVVTFREPIDYGEGFKVGIESLQIAIRGDWVVVRDTSGPTEKLLRFPVGAVSSVRTGDPLPED